MSKQSIGETFLYITHTVHDSPEFESLKPIDIAVLVLLLRKFDGFNNGRIPLGVREIARRRHCSMMTAWRALKNLEKAGIIELTRKGHMVPEPGRPDVATQWRVRFLPDAPKPACQPNRRASRNYHQPKKAHEIL
jgi:hypothetical protein